MPASPRPDGVTDSPPSWILRLIRRLRLRPFTMVSAQGPDAQASARPAEPPTPEFTQEVCDVRIPAPTA